MRTENPGVGGSIPSLPTRFVFFILDPLLTLADARRIIEAWREDYNTLRPHSALGDLTPEEFGQFTLNRAEPVGMMPRPSAPVATRGGEDM